MPPLLLAMTTSGACGAARSCVRGPLGLEFATQRPKRPPKGNSAATRKPSSANGAPRGLELSSSRIAALGNASIASPSDGVSAEADAAMPLPLACNQLVIERERIELGQP